MKALQFRMSVPKIVLARALGLVSRNAYTSPIGPVQLEEIPDAQVRGDRWVVVRPALTGVRKHAMEHYVDLCAAGEVDIGFLVTHRYPLEDWKAAFRTAIAKTTGCVKVAFTFADAPPT